MRCATSTSAVALGGSPRLGLGQHVLERTEHQGQRRAELVADVGEERGLGAIDFGQRFGATALLLVGLRVGDAGGDLAGDESEEAAVALVVQPVRIQPGDEDAGRPVSPCRDDRQDDGLVRRPVPGPGRQRSEGGRGQLDDQAACPACTAAAARLTGSSSRHGRRPRRDDPGRCPPRRRAMRCR